MAAGGQSQQDGKDNNTLLWGIFGVIIVSIVIWYVFNKQIKLLFLGIKYLELSLVYYSLFWLPEFILSLDSRVFGLINLLQDRLLSSNIDGIDLEFMQQISLFTGEYLRYPFSAIILLWGSYLVIKNPKNRLTNLYNMESLSSNESSIWPQIAPVINLNLQKADIETGPWAMAVKVDAFAKQHKLINLKVDKRNNILDLSIDSKRATEIFAEQLGKSWGSFDSLSPHRQALFAAFAARGCRNAKESLQLLQQLSISYSKGKLDFTGVRKIYNKYKNNADIKRITSSHLHELSVMSSMIMFAREDGVLACSDFIWLKPMDRKLFYILNTIGRQVAVPEVSGIYAHWLAERALGSRISTPMVEEATNALELGIADIKINFTEDELKEFSQDHKQEQELLE